MPCSPPWWAAARDDCTGPPDLTIRDNLRLALRSDRDLAAGLEHVATGFPFLRDRLKQRAGTLSGWERKMLILARALMMRPRLLPIDEITEGLQPFVVSRIVGMLRAERQGRGTAMLIVQRNLDFALGVADRWAVPKRGETDDAGLGRRGRGRVLDHLSIRGMDRRRDSMVEKAAIDVDDIAGAEALAGVRYTSAERALMVDNLQAQVDAARRRRAVPLPHDLPPACRFDPRPPGFVPPLAAPFRPAAVDPGPLPERDEDVAFAPVERLAGWIASRALTSERLTTIYLDRIARLGPKLECIACPTPDVALEQARAADAALAAGRHLGPLHGIPYGAKDLLDTRGIPTEWGAEPYRGRVPGADAVVVRRLAEAGAVLACKTTLGALAYGDIWSGGVTRNPWNIAEGSSGSSAGSGAAVAAGLVGFAIGTETLGSIVAPSMRCGSTGLRPTFGRVARTGAMPLCPSLDKIGPMCRSVADTALVLRAIEGADAGDPSSIPAAPFGYDAAAPVAGLRLGWFPADFALEGVEPPDREALDHARALGLELVELERPDLPYDALMAVLYAEAAASFEHLTLDDADDQLAWQDAGAWPNTFRKARFLSAVDLVQADRLRSRVLRDMDALFGRVDAMIGPCFAGPMLTITNFTGHPCLALRAGFRRSPTRRRLSLAEGRLEQGESGTGELHRVPHATCLWGRLFDEGTVVRIGAALEARFGVAAERPPIG